MRIKDFVNIDTIEKMEGDLDQEVGGLCYDSRRVGPGRVFFAISGEKADGHDFIAEAVRRGAAAVVFSRERPPLSRFVRTIRLAAEEVE